MGGVLSDEKIDKSLLGKIDFLARNSITRRIRNQIPLTPPGNQTFQQLPFGLAHAPRDLPQITQRQANDTPDEFRDNAHDY